MIRFDALESLGVKAAAMSDKSDGDCRLPSESNGYMGAEGRRQFLGVLDCNAEDLVCVRQVHGVAVTRVGEEHRGQGGLDAATASADCDAIITDRPGIPIGVSIADCVPVLLVDPGKRAIGIAHAGRLGTVGNIAARTVEAMVEAFGVRPGALYAVIGPSAGPDRYEVSAELADEFEALGLPRRGRMLDLWGANTLQLEASGVPAGHIFVTGHCTIEDDRYYSHRADGSGCRNLAVLAL